MAASPSAVASESVPLVFTLCGFSARHLPQNGCHHGVAFQFPGVCAISWNEARRISCCHLWSDDSRTWTHASVGGAPATLAPRASNEGNKGRLTRTVAWDSELLTYSDIATFSCHATQFLPWFDGARELIASGSSVPEHRLRSHLQMDERHPEARSFSVKEI